MLSPVRRAVSCAALVVAIVTLASAAGATEQARVGATEQARVGATEQARVEDDVLHCLALAMYWEAKGEDRGGMLAVGSVVLNRVEDPDHPDTVCAVVQEGGETPPCAFSFWCDGRPDEPVEEEPWAMARELAADLLASRPADPTGGAVFFHNLAVNPDWAAELEVTTQIGNHVFYR